ncbi:odorant receptor 94b-like [Drosophila rhopaloa]|uniref:Odorant receptor n=1 Tax=Drosophila rhopaloa TaxID=1041015 RepID=A0A6P4E6V5_DRORH|nr:odorant receptor 94b-like [Drosophila rhopaloa]XP_016969202.1 odorant receptor 94b-like [Drosophila rhopaloa]
MVMLRELTQWIWASDVDSGIIGSIELNVWLAQLMGLPLLDIKTESKPQRIRILATSCIVLPCLLCYVCLEIYDLVLNWNDVDVMTQNVVETLTHLGYWFKVLNTFYHYGEIKRIVSKFRFLTRTCVVSRQQRTTFHQVEVQNKLACLTYFCLTVFSSTMSLVMLLNEPDAMAGKRFPFRVYMPSWLPAPVQHLYMGLCLIVVCCGLTTIDNTNVLLMNQICLHLKVLNLSFEALELDLDRRLEVDPHSWMQSIVKYHCSLIDLRQRLERVYMLPVMFQFVSSLLVVAMTVFQMLLSDGSNSSVIMYFLLVGLMCQLFLYCWFGNEVFEQSKTLSISGFGCDWLQFDIRFRRCLLIFMVNAQRPLLFTAGGFMGLTLTSFANILGKSYSIVAVLRQMYGRAE